MSLKGAEITLIADCAATRIPAGDSVTLKAGESYHVAQALGGSVTLRDGGGLYRVGIESVAALGPEAVDAIRATANDAQPDDGEPFGEEAVWNALRKCFDPEIPVNIVDLGLIYDLRIRESDGAGDSGPFHVDVRMTLTATGCGMGPTIAADAKQKILSLPAVASASVEIVWDPQWTPHMISEQGRKMLGLD